MKSVPKLIRRFVGILLLSSILLLIVNFLILAFYVSGQSSNNQPWKMAEEVAEALQYTESDGYTLPETLVSDLHHSDVWAVYIDNSTMQVAWHTDNLPETVPMAYTLSDVANLTRGYIDGYPTFTGECESGLVVLGYPKTSFWKHMWPSWDYQLIAGLPKTFLLILAINTAIILFIYVIANTRLLHSVKPIVTGIQSLPTGNPVHVPETGLLSELALNINQTAEFLKSQNDQLRRKETARANWIAGVSHDIRTPLSMVMGYAGQLKDDIDLTDEKRQKAAVIVKQSERMKNLINDLNLASKLEYNMQPIKPANQNMIAIVRQVVVDFINMDIDGKHPIEWETDEALMVCPVNADKDLMKRAISNLIQNCINHNEQGCQIYVNITADNEKCTVCIADNGVGATDEQIETLNQAPHYMVCDENTTEQRHGLGLLIVKQIISAHNGTVSLGHSSYGGFQVQVSLPIQK